MKNSKINNIESELKKAKRMLEDLSKTTFKELKAINVDKEKRGVKSDGTQSYSPAATGVIEPYELGKTKSGKSIMSHPNHPAHNGFTAADHGDAYFAHANMAKSFEGIHPSEYNPAVLEHYNNAAKEHWNNRVSMLDAESAQPQYSKPKQTISALMNNDDKDDGYIHLVHYSTKKGLTHINPHYQGTGARGEETENGKPAVVRSNYYREGTKTEPHVVNQAKSKYHIKVDKNKLYDLHEDKDGIVRSLSSNNLTKADNDFLGQNAYKGSDEALQKIKQANYSGFFNSNHPSLPNSVAMFYPHKALSEHKIGPQDQHIAAVGDEKSHIPGSYGIMTPEFPVEGTAGTHEEFQKDLDLMGLKYEPVEGKYNNPENGYIIHGATHDQLRKLGEKYRQESVVHSDEEGNNTMIYCKGDNKGMMSVGKGIVYHKEKPDNYWTKHGDKIFTLKIDTDNKVPYEPPKPKSSNKGYGSMDWSSKPKEQAPLKVSANIKDKLKLVKSDMPPDIEYTNYGFKQKNIPAEVRSVSPDLASQKQQESDRINSAIRTYPEAGHPNRDTPMSSEDAAQELDDLEGEPIKAVPDVHSAVKMYYEGKPFKQQKFKKRNSPKVSEKPEKNIDDVEPPAVITGIL
jgi:hypothetical protein